MAESEVHSLLVKMEPRGMDEVQSELEDTREEFQETTDSVSEETAALTQFSKKFKGAGIVFGAVFTTLAAVIASKMPVLQESASGFNAVLDSIALKLSEDLRPEMNKFNQDLFETSDNILEAEGSWGALKEAVVGVTEALIDLPSTPAQRIGEIPPPEEWENPPPSFDIQFDVPTVSEITDSLPGEGELPDLEFDVDSNLPSIQDIKDGMPDISDIDFALPKFEVPEIDIGDPVDRGKELISDFTSGINEKIPDLNTDLGSIGDTIEDELSTLPDPIAWGEDLVTGFRDGVDEKITNLQTTLDEIAADIKAEFAIDSDAIAWGEDLVTKFIEGVKNKTEALKSFLEELRETIEDKIGFDVAANDRMARRWGEDLVAEFDRGVDRGTSETDIFNPRAIGGGRAPAGGGDVARQIERVLGLLPDRLETTVELDGRAIAQSQDRFLGQGASGIGRTRRGR